MVTPSAILVDAALTPLRVLQKEDGPESLPKRRLLPQRIAH